MEFRLRKEDSVIKLHKTFPFFNYGGTVYIDRHKILI